MTWASNSSFFSVETGTQRWTAPVTGQYTITAAGAVGLGGSRVIGRGAVIRATVALTQGVSYKILIGQAGTTSTSGGGGGGTFFTTPTNTPIIVAGGGGGGLGSGVGNAALADGATTTSGNNSSDSTGTGGTNGNGGTGSNNGWGSGGGGLSGNGTDAANCASTFGYSFVNGGAGGGTCSTATGGFGGGGGTHGSTGGGGGGGGYSGGGGSGQSVANANGGGGGSYVIAGATNIATSNGSYAGSTSGITNLAQYNGTAGSATYTPGYLTITAIIDAVTASIASFSGSNTATYRTVFQVVATLSSSGGKVTFYANGKVIPNCKKLYTSTTTVTCNWSPSVKRPTTITVTVIPDNGATYTQTAGTQFLVTSRVNTR